MENGVILLSNSAVNCMMQYLCHDAIPLSSNVVIPINTFINCVIANMMFISFV